MFHTIIKVASHKRSIPATVGAVLLLSATGCASTPFGTQDNNNSAIKTATQCKGLTSKQCMLSQLQQYQQTDNSAHEQYLAYKAQAWLNYATHQDSVNSRSPAGIYATQTAEFILQVLKNGKAQDISLYQDIPSMSTLMRPDLWSTLSALKDNGGIDSAPREMAFSEVALIWAATNQCTRGARESGSHFRMADRWLEQAREAYVNAHDSKTNVALERLIVRYYQHYAPLDASDDTCDGQAITSLQ